MDLNVQFVTEYSEHYIASRIESGRRVRYGNGSGLAAMIAACAAGIRRAAAAIEGWARGTGVEIQEYRLPRAGSVR